MERVALFSLILCSFVNVHLTSECIYDDECYGHGESRCCRTRDSDGGLCINRETCYGFCRDIDDCSAPEICDLDRNLCTTECVHTSECHDGYKCDVRHCVSDEDSTDSDFNVSSLVAIILGIGMIIFLLCCCAVRQARNSPPRIVQANRTSRAPRGTDTQQNGMGSIGHEAAEPHNEIEEFSDEVPDPIAQAAPPAYEDVNNQPESPPPSYEEVMRTSHEILPHDSASTQV